jgi:hypothetical protein
MAAADDQEQEPGGATARNRQLGLLLACYAGPKVAARTRGPLEDKLRSGGDAILDTVVLKVDERHKALVHDPSRLLAGTLTPGLTWGLAGLLGGGWQGLVIWGPIGALCGFWYAYYKLHRAPKAELAEIGTRLPAKSSALLTLAETSDPGRLLRATADREPSVASVAMIADDLNARVLTGADHPVAVPPGPDAHPLPPGHTALLSMIMLRYPDPGAARQAATRAGDAALVEVVLRTDPDGRRHVTDPKLGPWAVAKIGFISWGAFGAVLGVIIGISGGGVIKGGLTEGIVWGIFGLFAGALYGLWAGRSTSPHRLKGIGPLLAPGTSTLLAWADGPVSQQAIATLTAPQAQHLVLHFNPVAGGAILEAA